MAARAIGLPSRTGARYLTLSAAPEVVPHALGITAEAFWARVDRVGECWLWMGSRDRAGYGRVWFGRTQCKAHRVAYLLAVGPIVPGLEVCHRCDNPPCVRPDHLWLGTHRQNLLDCRDKGRLNSPRGERCGQSKLTADQVREIRMRLARGESRRAIAAVYGVSNVAITFIAQRKTWAHLDAEPEAVSA